eukprot:scaffold60052_cov59-Phaeocystis_antarctica.AAC.5
MRAPRTELQTFLAAQFSIASFRSLSSDLPCQLKNTRSRNGIASLAIEPSFAGFMRSSAELCLQTAPLAMLRARLAPAEFLRGLRSLVFLRSSSSLSLRSTAARPGPIG